VYDTDGKGYISRGELRRFLLMFTGESGTITLYRISAERKQKKGAARVELATSAPRMFVYDTDGNAYTSRGELWRFCFMFTAESGMCCHRFFSPTLGSVFGRNVSSFP
jgi:hypothetical protein